MTELNVSPVRAADSEAIWEAAQLLREGRLVAFPTETVYGLGADATNGRAVAAIFAAKARPQINPLIVHVRNAEQAAEYVQFSALAEELAGHFWPGPLTLVLPRLEGCGLSLLVSAGLDTVAIRCPSHPVAADLIEEAGLPIAAPSANPSGRLSPTHAGHVAEGLGRRVNMILDGGPTPLGIESTVIGFAAGQPVLFRPGALAREEVERITGPLAAPSLGIVSSPGQLASHYAPHARMRLKARDLREDEVLLGFGPDTPHEAALNLSPNGDLAEAAANLFAMLRTLDTLGARTIAVMPIPQDGLGEAINDRLARAAAPRGSGP